MNFPIDMPIKWTARRSMDSFSSSSVFLLHEWPICGIDVIIKNVAAGVSWIFAHLPQRGKTVSKEKWKF